MFTSIDKAIVAVIGGLLTIIAQAGIDVSAIEPYIAPLGSILTGALVYFIPNKGA